MYNTLMQSDENSEQQPVPATGFVFHPGDTLEVDHKSQPAAMPSVTRTEPAATVEQPKEVSAAPLASAPTSQPAQYQSPDPHDDAPVTWTASEFIAHQKGFEWYLGLALGSMLLASVVYAFTRDFVSSGMIIVVAIAFWAFAVKKPRVLQYVVDDNGITMGQKHYAFSMFKSFSIVDDGAAHSLLLMPMQRFMPSLSIYYALEDEERILSKVADHLPFEERNQDIIDRTMRRIRF